MTKITCKGDCKNWGNCVSDLYNYPKKESSKRYVKLCEMKNVDKLCEDYKHIGIELCESCGQFEVQWKLKDQIGDNKTYNVCTNCLQGLMLYDLSPVEYTNLLKNGHKPTEFLIHSDFYDKNGLALQPVV